MNDAARLSIWLKGTCLRVGFAGMLTLCAGGEVRAQNATISPRQVEFFEKHVRPILVEHCYECHAGDEQSGGLRVDGPSALRLGGDTGPALVPHHPDASLLIDAVRYNNPDLQMPPKQRITEAGVQTLVQWIAEGAADPRSDEEPSSPLAEPLKGMSVEEGRTFWSFQPLANPDVPPVSDGDWSLTAIDHFIGHQLDQHQLSPAPSADKATLLRRVTLDLTGLLPTTAELEAFLADNSPAAWSRVIDRLLNSPQYGVRWGRHWLDVARYADSNGLDENLAFGTAWRYRDYVIDAFNRDQPFDRFVMEQLAGDLLPDASRETKTATGFLVLGAKVLAEPDREKLVMDTIDEQLDTVGKVFMGMTLGCVRCHDHKFDPLMQRDYYALAAILKSTKTFGDTNTGAIKHWHEYVFTDKEQQPELKAIEAEIAEKKKAAASFKSSTYAKLRTEARTRAAEYLQAATQITPASSLDEVARIAHPAGLHAYVLFQCRRHLEFHRDDPFFAPWHTMASEQPDAIEAFYRQRFTDAEAALAEARKQDASAKRVDNPDLQAALDALNDASGFIALPTKPDLAFDAAQLEEYHRLAEAARLVESFAPDLDSAMGVDEAMPQTHLAVHIRGSHRNLGQPVARGFPEVMDPRAASYLFPRDQSGRLQLAQWLTSPTHPLTARVYVNRVWGWHFGEAIVRSTENFGTLGERPTHPDLLDWLTRYFIESGWSTKQLHRLILTSRVYQMDSQHPRAAEYRALDPENRWLWRFPRQRMDAEQIRDGILQVAGRLDQALGGKTVPLRNRQFVFDHTSIDHTRYDSVRRAAYLPVIRNNLYPLFEQFDFPDPTMPTGHRNTTTVAPQALWFMNADLVLDCAQSLAEKSFTASFPAEITIASLYRELHGREPQPAEIQQALQFLATETAAANSDLRAWTLLCHVMLSSNEFIYVR